MGNPTDELRASLDELGVEYVTSEDDTTIFYGVDGNRYTYHVNPISGWSQLYGYHLNPEQAVAATVGKDIEHYDGSGRRGTVAILQGGREPEEVLFVRDEGGVTHYLPEGAGTCNDLGGTGANGEQVFNCSKCGCILSLVCDYPRFCPECGRRIIEEEAE